MGHGPNWSRKETTKVKKFVVKYKRAKYKEKALILDELGSSMPTRGRIAIRVKLQRLIRDKKVGKRSYKAPKKYRLINAIIDDGGISKVNKIRKYRRVEPVISLNKLVLDIKDVQVDLENKKLTILY